MKNRGRGLESTCARTLWRALLFMVVLVLSSAVSLRAQEGGTIVGTVADPSGAVIPDAQVTATNQNTGSVTRTTATNSAGNYVFPGLPLSTYTIRVQKQGFTTAVHS